MSEGAITKCETVDFRNKQKRLCGPGKRIITSCFQEQNIFNLRTTFQIFKRMLHDRFNTFEQFSSSTT